MADNNAGVIKNGDSLGYGRIWGVNCPKNQPLAQGGIFINLKNDTNTLIFLHTILDTIGNGQKAFLKCVYETKINVLADSIISKNKIILYDTLYSGITCLLYTSDAADERSSVDLGGRRIIKKKTYTKNVRYSY